MKLTKEEALQKARDMFQKWNDALRTGDPKVVAELYTEDNMFLPTLSGIFEFGKEGDVEYFEHFLAKHPVGKIVEDDVRVENDTIIHAGFYDFEVDDGNGGRDTVEARFTFVWERNGGDWKIIHHHSSLKPINL